MDFVRLRGRREISGQNGQNIERPPPIKRLIYNKIDEYK